MITTNDSKDNNDNNSNDNKMGTTYPISKLEFTSENHKRTRNPHGELKNSISR